jgi:hypothetical protein
MVSFVFYISIEAKRIVRNYFVDFLVQLLYLHALALIFGHHFICGKGLISKSDCDLEILRTFIPTGIQ